MIAINERFQRRHIRVSPPGQGLPALRPLVPPPPRSAPKCKKKAEKAEIPRSIPALLRTVIAAVNARGICAAHAARLAELPVAEVDGIESLCECSGCRRMRAH